MTRLQKARNLRRYFVDCRDRKKCTLMDYTSMIAEIDKNIVQIVKEEGI